MSISAEEKVCYLREAAIVLAKEGFQLDEVHTDRLCIQLDGNPDDDYCIDHHHRLTRCSDF